MATLTTQVLVDGERNIVIKAFIEGGATELSDDLLVDVSALTPARSAVKIMAIKSSLEGFSANLIWDATTDVPALKLMSGRVEQDFRRFGGLVNDSGTGKTGDILISTYGSATGLDGSIILELKPVV